MSQEDAQYYQEHRDDPDEWGEPVEPRPRKRRLDAMLSVRLSPEEADLVRRAAASEGETVSDYIRNALLQRTMQGPSIEFYPSTVGSVSGESVEGSVASAVYGGTLKPSA